MPKVEMNERAHSAAAVDLSATDAAVDGFLYVGVGGDVKVDMADGGEGVTFKNVPTGVMLPLMVSKVYKTGTTATDILVCGARAY